MKWKIETPALGSKRTVRKFAWLPTEVEGHKVWLETFQTTEEYVTVRQGLTTQCWVEVRHWDHVLERIVYPERKLLYFAL